LWFEQILLRKICWLWPKARYCARDDPNFAMEPEPV
jgi:hypothetical protein